MSEVPVSQISTALDGARSDGFVAVEERRARGMITLRGDFADPGFVSAVTGIAELSMPGQRGVVLGGDRGLCWMSPDELLLMCTYAEAPILAAKLESALAGQHALVANVSDARAAFRLRGRGWREVLAKVAPVDLSPQAFGPGEMRRSRMAQVAAAFWMEDEDTAQVVCFRSVGGYVFNLLSAAAAPGSEVAYWPTS